MKVPRTEAQDSRDFIQSLERGLTVILAFSDHRPWLTVSQGAQITGLSRPVVRRILLTLQRLGYVRAEGDRFALTPRVLALGHAYLSSLSLTHLAQRHLERLSEATGQSCSLATLNGTQVVYVARVPTTHVMTLNLVVGTHLPAYATSMGRVLLAQLSPNELDDFFARTKLEPLTSYTITHEDSLRSVLHQVREQGWAFVDQELELGVRSIAAPVRDSTGQVVAAVNTATHANRVDPATLCEEFLPILLDSVDRISRELGPNPSVI